MIEVSLNSDDYVLAEAAAKNMWSSSKTGVYGSGLLNSSSDKFKTERIGRLGEVALSKLFYLPIDSKFREMGDDNDFSFLGIKIDVKTANRDYGKLLVYAQNERGKEIPLKSDIYVAAILTYESLELKKATIIFKGWCNQTQLVQGGRVPAMKGTHKNWAIDYSNLNSIESLFFCITSMKVGR